MDPSLPRQVSDARVGQCYLSGQRVHKDSDWKFYDFGQPQKTGFPYARAIFLWNIGMSTLQWSDSLVLGLPFMDDTHQEFVDLLATVVKRLTTTCCRPGKP